MAVNFHYHLLIGLVNRGEDVLHVLHHRVLQVLHVIVRTNLRYHRQWRRAKDQVLVSS